MSVLLVLLVAWVLISLVVVFAAIRLGALSDEATAKSRRDVHHDRTPDADAPDSRRSA